MLFLAPRRPTTTLDAKSWRMSAGAEHAQAGWGARVVLYPRHKADFTLAPIVRRSQLARVQSRTTALISADLRSPAPPPYPGRRRISRKLAQQRRWSAAQIIANGPTPEPPSVYARTLC